jgi:hypothetical protein
LRHQFPRPEQQVLGLRVGSIRPLMNRECAATMTGTGSSVLE